MTRDQAFSKMVLNCWHRAQDVLFKEADAEIAGDLRAARVWRHWYEVLDRMEHRLRVRAYNPSQYEADGRYVELTTVDGKRDLIRVDGVENVEIVGRTLKGFRTAWGDAEKYRHACKWVPPEDKL